MVDPVTLTMTSRSSISFGLYVSAMVAQLIAWYRDFANGLLTDGYLVLALPCNSDHPFGSVGPVLDILCWARDMLGYRLLVLSHEPCGDIRCSVHADKSIFDDCWDSSGAPGIYRLLCSIR